MAQAIPTKHSLSRCNYNLYGVNNVWSTIYFFSRLADRLAELETRSGSDESSSTRITPQQHPEPKKPLGQNAITLVLENYFLSPHRATAIPTRTLSPYNNKLSRLNLDYATSCFFFNKLPRMNIFLQAAYALANHQQWYFSLKLRYAGRKYCLFQFFPPVRMVKTSISIQLGYNFLEDLAKDLTDVISKFLHSITLK